MIGRVRIVLRSRRRQLLHWWEILCVHPYDAVDSSPFFHTDRLRRDVACDPARGAHLQTAVGRYIAEHHSDYRERLTDIAAGFQEAVVDVLVYKLIRAAHAKGCRRIALAGGVAANSRLRERLIGEAADHAADAYLPSPALCGDNAAMVAAAGYHLLGAGRKSGLEDDVFSRNR